VLVWVAALPVVALLGCATPAEPDPPAATPAAPVVAAPDSAESQAAQAAAGALAADQAAQKMRALSGDCRAEFSGTCYPVWFGTNRRPLDRHNPALGWSDGLRTGVGINGTVLGRATPTVVNTAYNTQFMWDGRKKSLEDQALGPMKTPEEMKTDFGSAIKLLNATPGYREMFARAYPGEPIAEDTVAKAIAAFERTVVSRDSRFDRWVQGDRTAITAQEWRGYQLFKDPAKGNCAVCHSGPNFTDNGYHNIGIAHAPGAEDAGRFNIRKLPVLKGAFKTPTLRDVELTAPYFHNGTATTLAEVVDHYARGGDDRSNLSKDVRQLDLSEQDKADLVAFMKTLTGPTRSASIPALPQ